jgi:hypothetical protein
VLKWVKGYLWITDFNQIDKSCGLFFSATIWAAFNNANPALAGRQLCIRYPKLEVEHCLCHNVPTWSPLIS